MATAHHTPDSLDRLYRDLGYQPLSHWWGRAEIFLGLLCMATSMLVMLYLAVDLLHTAGERMRVEKEGLVAPGIASAFLFALGGYLALAGHRRHLYESNDRLTAYLADLVRPQLGRTVGPADVTTANGSASQAVGTGLRPSETPA